MVQEHSRHYSRLFNSQVETIRVEPESGFFLEPGALVMESSVQGKFYMERFAAINRCTVTGPAGLGSFAYASDAAISAFVHIGARSSVGGFEHPIDQLSTSSFFWGQNVEVLGSNLNLKVNLANKKPSALQTVVGPDVWVGSNSVILSGVTLSTGCVVGAGSVVTRDTEPYGIYIGNPGRLHKFRFSENVVAELLDSRWWELPVEFLVSLDVSSIHESLGAVRDYRGGFRTGS